MQFSEITEFVNRLEQRRGMYEDPLDNRHIWEYIRANIWLAAREKHTESGPVDLSTAATTRRQLTSLARSLVDPRRNPFARSGEILCLGFNRRRHREDGHWWDVIFDPILSELFDSWIYIEPPNLKAPGLHYQDSKTDSERHLYGDVFEYFPRIWERLPGDYPKLSSKASKRLERIETDIQTEIGLEVDLRDPARAIRMRYDIEKRLYQALFWRHDPHAVVVAGTHRMAIETARDAGIPTVELQHGTINKHQSRFAYPDGVRPATMADHLFVWGPGWIDKSELPRKTKLHTVGYAYGDEEVARATEYKSEEWMDSQLVVVSQFFVGKRLATLALELDKQLPETRIVFKPHPIVENVWRQAYPELADESVSVVTSEERSLYEVFANSTAQVGVSSTAVFEGLRFGLNSYILDEFTADYCDQLLNADAATLVSGAADISAAFSGQRVKHDTEPFFATDSAESVDSALKRVCRE